jgi:hypothetical protein
MCATPIPASSQDRLCSVAARPSVQNCSLPQNPATALSRYPQIWVSELPVKSGWRGRVGAKDCPAAALARSASRPSYFAINQRIANERSPSPQCESGQCGQPMGHVGQPGAESQVIRLPLPEGLQRREELRTGVLERRRDRQVRNALIDRVLTQRGRRTREQAARKPKHENADKCNRGCGACDDGRSSLCPNADPKPIAESKYGSIANGSCGCNAAAPNRTGWRRGHDGRLNVGIRRHAA